MNIRNNARPLSIARLLAMVAVGAVAGCSNSSDPLVHGEPPYRQEALGISGVTVDAAGGVTRMRISGWGISTVPGGVTVRVGGVKVGVERTTPTFLIAAIPDTVLSGIVSVESGASRVVSKAPVAIPPYVRALEPAWVMPGEELLVRLAHIRGDGPSVRAFIGGRSVPIVQRSRSLLRVRIPNVPTFGEVMVVDGGDTARSNDVFGTVRSPYSFSSVSFFLAEARAHYFYEFWSAGTAASPSRDTLFMSESRTVGNYVNATWSATENGMHDESVGDSILLTSDVIDVGNGHWTFTILFGARIDTARRQFKWLTFRQAERGPNAQYIDSQTCVLRNVPYRRDGNGAYVLEPGGSDFVAFCMELTSNCGTPQSGRCGEISRWSMPVSGTKVAEITFRPR